MMKEFDILAVRVINKAPWGISVQSDADPLENSAFIDKFKLAQWLESEEFPPLDTVLIATVIDASRDPARMSALDLDIEIARRRISDGPQQS
ncbi:hypothetical protein SAMN05421505_1315 [Sinosporangium album]|uniref:Uncharacterized protein n=1 Tax=Sinosporangium album TaxID=504805 RepID=A0A1G8H7D6_9ACTN|nr:hypothetical protein SAMN05421505_1315 [Sinosporangium album]